MFKKYVCDFNKIYTHSKLIFIFWNLRRAFLHSFPLPDGKDDLGSLGVLLKWIWWDKGIVGEDALWEGLAGSLGTQVGVESEWLTNWEVCLDVRQWLALARILRDDLTSPLCHNLVNGSHAAVWRKDFNEVQWLQQHWLGYQLAAVHGGTCAGHKLAGTSMKGVCVEGCILQLEAGSGKFFSAKRSSAADHLESRVDVLLRLVEVLNSSRCLQQNVAHEGDALWTEVPDLTSFFNIPTELVSKHSGSDLWILVVGDLALLDGLDYTVADVDALEVKSVVFVGRLGHDLTLADRGDGFSVLDDWLCDCEWNCVVAEVFLQVLQTDFQVEFADSCNYVLACFLVHDA